MQQIPITLQAQTTNVGIAPADFNQLNQLVASNLTAFIAANVSFFASGTSVPSAFVTQLFFNISNGYFYNWDTGNGAYIGLTPYVQGQTIYTFTSGDNVNGGFVVLDGRAVSAVPGVSARQLSVMQSLFGVGGNLPIVNPLQALTNLPGTGAFADINNPSVAPPTGQFANITVNSPPQQADVQAVTANCETLDASVQSVQEALASVIVQSESMLDALNGAGGPTMYSLVFIGLP